jgi:hypothetical protein
MRILLTGLSAILIGMSAGPALAKLPVVAPTPEAAAKAEEAKAKAAEAAKKESELLGKAQDKAAANWAGKLRAQGKEFKPTVIPAPAAPVVAAAPAAAATVAAKPAVAAPAAPATTPAAAPKK